jgi:hypothetical protein
VYALDPHTGSFEDPDAATFAEIRAKLARAGLADQVEPLVMTSAVAARVVDGPIELLLTRRRGLLSAAWGVSAGLLLYLYDDKRPVRRAAQLAGGSRRHGGVTG